MPKAPQTVPETTPQIAPKPAPTIAPATGPNSIGTPALTAGNSAHTTVPHTVPHTVPKKLPQIAHKAPPLTPEGTQLLTIVFDPGEYIAILAGVVNFLPHPNPPRGFGKGLRNSQMMRGLLYLVLFERQAQLFGLPLLH